MWCVGREVGHDPLHAGWEREGEVDATVVGCLEALLGEEVAAPVEQDRDAAGRRRAIDGRHDDVCGDRRTGRTRRGRGHRERRRGGDPLGWVASCHRKSLRRRGVVRVAEVLTSNHVLTAGEGVVEPQGRERTRQQERARLLDIVDEDANLPGRLARLTAVVIDIERDRGRRIGWHRRVRRDPDRERHLVGTGGLRRRWHPDKHDRDHHRNHRDHGDPRATTRGWGGRHWWHFGRFPDREVLHGQGDEHEGSDEDERADADREHPPFTERRREQRGALRDAEAQCAGDHQGEHNLDLASARSRRGIRERTPDGTPREPDRREREGNASGEPCGEPQRDREQHERADARPPRCGAGQRGEGQSQQAHDDEHRGGHDRDQHGEQREESDESCRPRSHETATDRAEERDAGARDGSPGDLRDNARPGEECKDKDQQHGHGGQDDDPRCRLRRCHEREQLRVGELTEELRVRDDQDTAGDQAGRNNDGDREDGASECPRGRESGRSPPSESFGHRSPP